MRFNFESCSDKMERMFKAVGVVLEIADVAELADGFEKLVGDIGLPTRLSELKVTAAHLEGMPEAAMRDHCNATNPRKVTLEDCQAAYQAAL